MRRGIATRNVNGNKRERERGGKKAIRRIIIVCECVRNKKARSVQRKSTVCSIIHLMKERREGEMSDPISTFLIT